MAVEATSSPTHQLGALGEGFLQHLLANRYIGPSAPQAAPLTLLQLSNIYSLTFKPEYELLHGAIDKENLPGSSASEVLLHLRSCGLLTLDAQDRLIGLPMHGAPAALAPARALTPGEEAGLRAIKKSPNSPLTLLTVTCGPGGYFSLLAPLVAAVGERAPSVVVVMGASPPTTSSSLLAWPGYSFTRRGGLLVHHSTRLSVEEVVVEGGGEAMVLRVTQGTRPSLHTSLLAILPSSCLLPSLPTSPTLVVGHLPPELPPSLHRHHATAASSLPPSDLACKEVAIGGGEGGVVVEVGSSHCGVCGVWCTTTAHLAAHKEGRSHRRNRLFQLYQREKAALLRSPHPLGLEVRVGEVEQGVVHSPEQGTVTITTSPGQARAFQVVLLNTRETDAAEEREEGKPDQIGLIVEQMGVMRAETVFQLKDEHGLCRQDKKEETKIRLRTNKRYRVEVRALATQVGVYKVPFLVAFYHDTASQKFEAVDKNGKAVTRHHLSHLALEFHLRVQSKEMASLAVSRPFLQPRRLQGWGGARDVVRVTVPRDLQQDRSGDQLRKALPLAHYTIPGPRRRMLATNFQRAESEEEREQVARCRGLLERRLAWEAYRERWALLLHAEEQQLETDLRHHDMADTGLKQLPCRRLFELQVPGLQENRPSVLRGDKIQVRVGQGGATFEGHVHQIREDKVELLFHDKFISRFVRGMKFDVRFTISRFPMRMMHRAVEVATEPGQGLRDLLFPGAHQLKPAAELRLPELRCKNRKIEENQEQLLAVQHIVSGSSGTAPYLVFGPPGTGKTVTVVEAIKQVYDLGNCRVLALAPSNAAADLLAERLKDHIQKRHLLRLHAASRALATVPEALLPVSNIQQGKYVFPPLEQLSSYSVIVATLVSSGRLVSAGFPAGHFTHVFVDEAGQATEPEVAIPLALLAGGGRLVLVGDPRQLGPVIRSPLGARHGLHTSLLERLMEEGGIYSRGEAGYDPRCITKLVRNFRSHPALLEVPGRLYYHGELKPCADQAMVTSCLQFPGLPEAARGATPLIFRGVVGQDLKEETSPSFFNAEEAVTVLEYVQMVLGMKENRVMAREVGVITPYRRQVQKIRKKLLEHNLREVTVGSTEEFQGQERKVIIVSTVRSTPQYVHVDSQYRLGFLSNPKRFNVAITRAKALLIVVGNPHILSQDPDWSDLLEFARSKGCYTGCPYNQETDAEMDRLESKLHNLLVKDRREEEITLLTQMEEPAWRSDF